MEVYVAHSPDRGLVKIGTTGDDSERRVRAIASAFGSSLQLVRVYEDAGRRVERKLHNHFASYRVQGEWFRGEILAFLPKEVGTEEMCLTLEPGTSRPASRPTPEDDKRRAYHREYYLRVTKPKRAAAQLIRK